MPDFLDHSGFWPVLNNLLFWVLLGLLLWNACILLFNKGVPNIRTEPATQRAIIDVLRRDIAARGGAPYTIIDLGSGNGGFTRAIARSLPEARVVGLEISGHAYLWAAMLRKLFKINNLSYRRADFFKADLSEAGAVVFYLSLYEMGRLGQKLREELEHGTLVISNRFRLGADWQVAETIDVRTLYPFEKEFHVYYQE